MNRKFYSTALLIAMLATTAIAQKSQPLEMAYKVKDQALNKSKIEDIAQFMTDKLGPRLAASKMKQRAENLVIEKLDSLGLPGAWKEFAWDFSKGGWDNERTYVAMTAPYYTAFAANPKAWSGSTDGLVKGECIVFEVNTPEDLEKYKGKIGGKILLMPSARQYEPDYGPTGSRLTEKELQELTLDNRPRKRRNWQFRPVDMKLQQMIDSVIKVEKPLAKVVGDGVFNIPGSRGVRYKSGDPEPLPEIALPIEDHGRMIRLIKSGEPVEMELDIRNVFSESPVINNVIVEIPGTDPKLKNEVVLLGAHLDSWHGGTGAADNASGAITMIEALRILKDLGVKPRRTIRLALWGAEEQGLYGSRGYAKTRLYDTEKKQKGKDYDDFALYLNMDNGSGRFRGIYMEQNDMARPFFEAWKAPIESLGFTTLSPQKTGGTDHVSFQSLGLPAYQFIQDMLDYFRTYHTPMDTYERLSLDDLKVNAAIAAWLAYSAAMDDNRIPVLPGYPEAIPSSTRP